MAGVPIVFNSTVMVRLPFATLDWAKLVKSHSIQPVAGVSVRVERVISLVVHATLLFQVTDDSLKVEHACAEIVVDEVPVTPVLYMLSIIEVGVIADGHVIELKSNSR